MPSPGLNNIGNLTENVKYNFGSGRQPLQVLSLVLAGLTSDSE